MTTTRQIDTSQLTWNTQQKFYDYLKKDQGTFPYLAGGGGIMGKVIFLKFEDDVQADRIINELVMVLKDVQGFTAKKTSDGNIVITNATLNKYQIKKSKFKKKYK